VNLSSSFFIAETFVSLETGTLLTRFSEKSLKYRVQVNPLRGSILWKMEVPPIGEVSSLVITVALM
jgi:hypothetical protein